MSVAVTTTKLTPGTAEMLQEKLLLLKEAALPLQVTLFTAVRESTTFPATVTLEELTVD